MMHFASFSSFSWLTSMGVVRAASLNCSELTLARRAIDLHTKIAITIHSHDQCLTDLILVLA